MAHSLGGARRDGLNAEIAEPAETFIYPPRLYLIVL